MIREYNDIRAGASKTQLNVDAKVFNLKSSPLWLLTFVDLISLLLAFFIMMFSMSSIKMSAWDIFKGSLDHEQTLEGPSTANNTKQTISKSQAIKYGLNLGYLRSILETGLKKEKLLKNVSFTFDSERLLISLPTKLIFEKGSSALSRDGKKALFLLAETLSNFKNDISLVGHSDPTPMVAGAKYENNWVLSLSRAYSVAQTLKNAGYRKSLKILSFADTRFNDISNKRSVENRHQLARRVDIMVHKEWQQ